MYVPSSDKLCSCSAMCSSSPSLSSSLSPSSSPSSSSSLASVVFLFETGLLELFNSLTKEREGKVNDNDQEGLAKPKNQR